MAKKKAAKAQLQSLQEEFDETFGAFMGMRENMDSWDLSSETDRVIIHLLLSHLIPALTKRGQSIDQDYFDFAQSVAQHKNPLEMAGFLQMLHKVKTLMEKDAKRLEKLAEDLQ